MKFLQLLFLTVLCNSFSFAQVGVNTTTIDASAALDIQYGSSPKGLLTPRMTTAQKSAILNPADGLIVYDTDIKSFYHYKTGSPGAWIRMSSEASGRTNFKRIKSTDVLATVLAAEKVAGGGTKYELNANTYYEINGAVNFDLPIELNNAYLVGLDANEDKIVRAGNLFVGTKGGTIKNVSITVTGGNVFSLVGTVAENLLLRDCIISGCLNVGSISGYGLVFSSVVQYVGNTTGIVYNNINQLLLSNIGWFGNNTGTYEKLTGTFKLVQKQGGFSEVNGSAIGFDVSSNPVISGDALLGSVVFTGTNPAGFVNPYPLVNRYKDFNFSNSWTVDSPGVPREGDAEATGDINLDAAVGTGQNTSFSGTGAGSRMKLNGTTTSNNLFRFTKDANNRITYRGNKPRYFQVAGSVSYQGNNDLTLILYIAKNGIVITETKVYGKGTSGFLVTSGILALPLVGTVQMKKDDYIEIWAERYSGSGDMQTVSLNLIAG